MGGRQGSTPAVRVTRPVLTPEAEADLGDAFAWYEEQVPGLGREFVLTAEEHLVRIGSNPLQYQQVYRGVRRAVMRRFPYAVFYMVEESVAVVLAVQHQARDPEHWKRRL